MAAEKGEHPPSNELGMFRARVFACQGRHGRDRRLAPRQRHLPSRGPQAGGPGSGWWQVWCPPRPRTCSLSAARPLAVCWRVHVPRLVKAPPISLLPRITSLCVCAQPPFRKVNGSIG